MKKQNLLLSQIEKEGFTFLPNVSFDNIRKNLDVLEKRVNYLEEALEEERKVNVNERYEEEISYLHKQLSYCPFQLNEKQYEKFNNFLRTHSHCRPDKKDSHYAFYFSPSSIGIAADLQCKYCGDYIEIIGSEDW